MKIAFDISTLQSGHKRRGIGFYTKNLLEALQKKNIDIQTFVSLKEIKTADIVHFTTFDFFFPTLKLDKRFRNVVTIADITPLIFPKHYPPGLRGKWNWWKQRRTLNKVDHIITISEYSKKDICQYLTIPEEKVSVTYLAPADHFKPTKQKSKYNLPEKFVVFVGSVNWNKNIVVMAQAAVNAGVNFVLVGKSFETKYDLDHPELREYKEFRERFAKNPLIHILGFVSDEELVAILNQATALLYVSRYEGFGLPILEAQACDLPVITSVTSSMPEIAGDGALFVHPDNIDEISQTIQHVTEDESLQKQLIEKGRKNVKRFSWEKTAEQTIQIYEKVFKS